MQDIAPLLTKQRAESVAAYQRELGKQYPILASATSVGTNLISGITTPIMGAIDVLDGQVDPYNAIYAMGTATQALRGGVTERAAEAWRAPVPWDADTSWGKFVYSAGMSMADNLATLFLAKGVGGAAGLGGDVVGKISLGLMSSQAGSATYIGDIQSGVDPTQALLHGVTDAMIEAFTEKFSIDQLLADPKQFLPYLAKNAGVEFSEEAFGDVLKRLEGAAFGGVWDEVGQNTMAIYDGRS